jgi:hypothetical protein
MADARDSAQDWRSRVPERLRDACTPAACIRAVHGIEPGAWACPECGRVFEVSDYPGSFCAGCGRPLPQRCERRDEDRRPCCANLVEPTRHVTERSGKDPVVTWDEPGAGSPHGIVCDDCASAAELEFRQARLQKIIPDKERRALTEGYQHHPHRLGLDLALQAWIKARCGRDDHRPWLIVYGEPGTGKTLALLRYGSIAYHRGLVGSIGYVTEEELLRSASLEWSDNLDERAAAKGLIRTCHDVELLVFDEAGAAAKLTDAQHRKYSGLMKQRADAEKPTLIAMNRNTDVNGRAMAWLDIRVDSRLEQVARVVRCADRNGGSVDLRRAQR